MNLFKRLIIFSIFAVGVIHTAYPADESVCSLFLSYHDMTIVKKAVFELKKVCDKLNDENKQEFMRLMCVKFHCEKHLDSIEFYELLMVNSTQVFIINILQKKIEIMKSICSYGLLLSSMLILFAWLP